MRILLGAGAGLTLGLLLLGALGLAIGAPWLALVGGLIGTFAGAIAGLLSGLPIIRQWNAGPHWLDAFFEPLGARSSPYAGTGRRYDGLGFSIFVSFQGVPRWPELEIEAVVRAPVPGHVRLRVGPEGLFADGPDAETLGPRLLAHPLVADRILRLIRALPDGDAHVRTAPGEWIYRYRGVPRAPDGGFLLSTAAARQWIAWLWDIARAT